MPVNVTIQPFTKEFDFEKALANQLTNHGWEPAIILNPTEEQLIKNWAAIIFNNNRGINQLGEFPLTDTEMQQVIQQVNACKNPYERNLLINGCYVNIKRDNKEDLVNFGKVVYLKIFDPLEIRQGQSVYQIVRQPKFETRHPLARDRRGDVMLLINGMPVIHIELKRSGVDVTQAVNQIKKYTHEGVFSQGIFSLVQIFVAMTPEKTLYFANPGASENFTPSFYFHWADDNNDEVFDWRSIAANLLSIPMAHHMIGSYTIADDKDKTLKVLRSYQYYAANKICDRVHQTNWDDHAHKGGFIWHTTGSGKTMTSFKAAHLIGRSGDADKVVFLLDRIELSTQSADEYRGFANANDNVLDTDNTASLIRALESDAREDCLIVTSLQKMSRVNTDNHVPESTIKHINSKRVVFIIDECHRSVRGTGNGESGSGMLLSIKNTFPRAILFGFTGTPIFEENAKGEITTEVIFGDMLDKYTLANGIPDNNVLGFDLYREDTFKEEEIREQYALKQLKAETVDEIEGDEQKMEAYNKLKTETDIIKIENEVKKIYESDTHHLAVMNKIVEERPLLSRNGKFHAILATKNIPEAIEYYHLFKEHYPEYNVTAIFDDSIDNNGGGEYKEDAILEMLEDYNKKFGTNFQQTNYAMYKKDVAKRLAHKVPYQKLEKSKQLDLLIVVTQMLTGYDSKWVNTLYVDKILYYVDVIQAFSRTNRLFGPEKPFGIIKYFTRPNLMSKNIDDALKLYVDQPLSVFTDKLESNLEKINAGFRTIDQLFKAEGITDYSHLPKAEISRKKFAKEFCEMTKHLEAAKMQGFNWDKDTYEFQHTNGWVTLKMELDEQTYLVLLQRYKELFQKGTGGGGDDDDDVYQLEAYITETGAGTIDADYINSKFVRFIKYLYTSGPDSEMVKKTLQDLHTVFAQLSQRDQRTALTIIHDIQSGDLHLKPGKTIYDYINDYQKRECDQYIYTLSESTGLDAQKLKVLIENNVNEQTINEHGLFDELMDTFDTARAAEFSKKITGKDIDRIALMATVSDIVRRFIINPIDRAKIIFALQNENAFLDVNIPEDLPEEKPKEELKAEDNKLSDEEKRENVRQLVMADLRGINNMPASKDVVDAFFKIITISSLPHLDGIAIDFYKVFDELFARKKVNWIDKHTDSGTLLVRFEVYLKKLYYLLKGEEVPGNDGDDKATLGNAVKKFPCLHYLGQYAGRKYPILKNYLNLIFSHRNTQSGNGAHFSYFSSEEEVDRNIKALVTMYMYVTGMCLDELRDKYDILEPNQD